MKSFYLYQVNLIDGREYRGEIAYKDDKMLVLKIRNNLVEQKIRLFYNSIVSIQELGWQRAWLAH